MTMDEKAIGDFVLFSCRGGDGVGVARSEERRRERKERALFFFSRRRRFASNTHRARARFDRCERDHKRRFCRTRILFLVLFSKGRTLFYSFSSCRPKSGEKSGRRGFFFSLYRFTHSFFLPHPFLNAVQLRCTNDARPGMGERFLLQERRSGSRAEMASVDGPSVDWPRRHDVALEKSRDEATDARPRLVVGIRVTGHGHTKRCVQAGTVGRERRVLRWYGFVDC